jgi:hypothetical protein
MSATNLLVQREQADSNLRAGMFHDLIGPIVGSATDKRGISVDRERLLAELLALNFHEHFELKPLMMHVDERLASEDDADMSPAEREHARESLRSAARRVLQRQVAMLIKAEKGSSPADQQACVYDVGLRVRDSKPGAAAPPVQRCATIERFFDDLISIDSPDGVYTLTFTISNTPQSWESQSFLVSMGINRKDTRDKNVKSSGPDQRPKPRIADKDFLLTWFDFPFSDNTLLADGTRFSLVIDHVEPFVKRANFKLVWFPQDYFAAQERPTNYRQFRDKLGLGIKQ